MPFPFIAAAAVLGGLLGGIAQRSKNKAIKRSARAAQGQINKQIVEARVKFGDDIRRRSGIGQMLIAEARNRFGAQTGLSISERLAAMAADMTLDTEAIKASQKSLLDRLQFQKTQVLASAQAKVKSIGQSAVEGAIQFATTAADLSLSFKQLKVLDAAAKNAAGVTIALGGLDAGRQASIVLQNPSLQGAMTTTARDARGIIEGQIAA